MQKQWLDLARSIRERCQVWFTPKAHTLSYRLTVSASPKLFGEAHVFYCAPDLFRVETLAREDGEERTHTFIFRDGRLWRREGKQPFVDVAKEILQLLGESKGKVAGQLFETLTFLRGVQVRFALDEILEAPERCKVEDINEKHPNCIQVTLTKPGGFSQAKVALGLQHFVRSFATNLAGTKVILCLHAKTFQPLTEIILNESREPQSLHLTSIVSYKDFGSEFAPKRVDLTSVVGGWTWTVKMEFDLHAGKVWLLRQGEGWGEFLEPGLMRTVAKVTDVHVDEPLPEKLFELG